MLLNSAPKRSKIQATKGQKTPKLYGLLGRIYASVVFAREQRSPWSMASARCDAQSRLSCGVRPSLSVCLSRSRTLSKRINISSKIFHQQVATLFKFLYQTSWQYSNGNPPPLTGASNVPGTSYYCYLRQGGGYVMRSGR